MRNHAVLLLGLLIALLPSEALARKPKQAHDDAVWATRITPYVGVAGAGRASVRSPGWRTEGYNMRGGGHLGTRLEFPIMEFFSLGGMAEFGGTSIRRARRSDLHLDLSFWAKGRYVIDLKPFDLEVYAGIPIGMSFAFVDWNDPAREFGPGFNSGFMFGAQFLFKNGGFFTDMGPRFRRSWYDDFDGRWSYGTRQFNMNFGGVLYF
jgi:hypothetical protein